MNRRRVYDGVRRHAGLPWLLLHRLVNGQTNVTRNLLHSIAVWRQVRLQHQNWAFQLGLGLCTWVEANVTAVTAGTWPFASRCCDRCDRCDRGLSTSLSGSRCRSPVLVGGALFRYCVCVCVCCVRKCVRGVPVCPCVLLL